MDISLVMVVRNEVGTIGESICQASRICKEMIVVDTGSTDGTQQQVERLGARLLSYNQPKDDSYNIVPARNYGIAYATMSWILWYMEKLEK